jgi:hypothetical protein
MSKPKIAEPTVSVDGLRVSTIMLLAGALILFVFSGYMWNRFILSSDKRIFWDAIGNSLSADGVQIVADDSTDGKLLKATILLDTSGDISVEARSEYKDEIADSVIKTVSTKEKDYLFYEKNSNTAQPRLKEFEGTWVDISAPDQTESKTLADQFTNGALILTGNLTSSDRKTLVRQMQADEVYTVVKYIGTREIAGVESRVYKIRINSIGFNKSLKSYFKAIGLDQAAAQVGEESGEENLQPEVEIAVDSKRRNITATGYPTLDATGAREYSNWDKVYSFELPTSSISADELQKKLDTIYTPTTN